MAVSLSVTSSISVSSSILIYIAESVSTSILILKPILLPMYYMLYILTATAILIGYTYNGAITTPKPIPIPKP